jgi:hypothetical protein
MDKRPGGLFLTLSDPRLLALGGPAVAVHGSLDKTSKEFFELQSCVNGWEGK